MDAAIRDAYLETQIATATPQRLRLMLIEQALRRVHAAELAFEEGRTDDAGTSIGMCRDLVTELIAGIQPDQSPLARRVLGLYTFLYSTLIEVQYGGDAGRLADITKVLDEERITWQAVCEQMPDRPAASQRTAEEFAPQRVKESWSAEYHAGTASGHARVLSESLTLDA